MNETILKTAVDIAGKVMQAAGLCRYDDPTKCKKVYVGDETCAKCISKWLVSKAKSVID